MIRDVNRLYKDYGNKILKFEHLYLVKVIDINIIGDSQNSYGLKKEELIQLRDFINEFLEEIGSQ